MSIRATAQTLDRLTDGQLVERAQTGEQAAFGELYDRYFERIYDFLTRMMRSRSEAEDITQDTFIRAMRSLDKLDNPASFKSWIFTIARNTALNRLQQSNRTRSMPSMGDDTDETLELNIVDTDRLGSPQDAVQAEAVASLVWEAASGLNSKQYSLLDLHIRQGLDSGEIAEVLNVSRNNAYVMLNRMKAALAETVTAYIMMNEGRSNCPDLAHALDRASIGRFSPAARKVVARHITSCEICQDAQAQLVSPIAILGALVPAPAAFGVRESIRDNVMSQWPAAGTAPADSGQDIRQPGPQLLASIVSIVVGVAILAGLIYTSFANDDSGAPAQTGADTAMIFVFNDSNGDILEGVGIQLFSPDSGEPVVSAATGPDGSITWDDAVPGTYDLIIDRLPPGIDLPDDDRLWQVQVEPGERLVLTATVQTVGTQ